MIKQRKIKTSVPRRTDIIQSILASDKEGVLEALREDPSSINTVHEQSSMNAVMLATYGRLPEYVDAMVEVAGDHIDFSHRSALGDDLMVVALQTLDRRTIQAVQSAYEKHAPHIVNNWPEP